MKWVVPCMSAFGVAAGQAILLKANTLVNKFIEFLDFLKQCF